MVARLTGSAERLDDAQQLAESVLALPSDIPSYTNMARAALALVAVERGDGEFARIQYAALHRARGLMVHYVSADRLLGLLARTMGQVNQATIHFEDALNFCRRSGYRPELASTCCDYGETLLERQGSGDEVRAQLLLEEAQALAQEVGMEPLLQRLGQGATPGESRQAAIYPDGLTQREVEVLRAIAAGKSNNEIARDLVLSVRTVERHITNIYTKISARGRADATSYTLSHGLAH